MATKYKFCHYTFSDGSRVTNMVRNYFCHEIFLQIKFRLSVTNFLSLNVYFLVVSVCEGDMGSLGSWHGDHLRLESLRVGSMWCRERE